MGKNIKCYIFAGSPDAKCSELGFDSNRYVICADGGYALAKKLGIKPDVLIGDFDTYKKTLPDDCEIIRHTERTHPKRNIIVDMYDEIIPVMADANLIVQVIVNLMDNAVKYSDEDSDVTVSVRRENAHAVVISVSDHGTGISDEEKEKVFDMFYTGGSRSSDSRRSLGLGLALCRSIITSHGGTISVSDNIPNGTVVSFTLPIGEVDLNE